jgi:hypothetical protein
MCKKFKLFLVLSLLKIVSLVFSVRCTFCSGMLDFSNERLLVSSIAKSSIISHLFATAIVMSLMSGVTDCQLHFLFSSIMLATQPMIRERNWY